MSFVTTPAVESEDGWRNLADYVLSSGVTYLQTGNYYVDGTVYIPTNGYLTFATDAVVKIKGIGGTNLNSWARIQRNNDSGTSNCLVYYGTHCTVEWSTLSISNYQTSSSYIVSSIASSASFGGDVTYTDCYLYRSGGSCIARFQGGLNNFAFVRTIFETPNTTATSAMFRFDHDYGKMWFDGCKFLSGGNCSIFHKVAKGFDMLKLKDCHIYMKDNNGTDMQKKLLFIQGPPADVWEMEITNCQLDGVSQWPLWSSTSGTWERCLFTGNVDLVSYYSTGYTHGYKVLNSNLFNQTMNPFYRGPDRGFL